MYLTGFQAITNIDISKVVIEQSSERYSYNPDMKWLVMNASSLEFKDETFDVVIAKGLLDAILCGESSTANTAKLCAEVSRVLKPGGIFFIVSYGTPENRLNHLDKEDLYGWIVEVLTIPKPTISAAALPASDDVNGFHYIYICRKSGGSGGGGGSGGEVEVV